MSNNLVKLALVERQEGRVEPNKWLGRLAAFELITGSRVSGRIVAVNETWIDLDNGTIKIEHIVHARWIGDEEAQITHGGPLGSYDPRQLRR